MDQHKKIAVTVGVLFLLTEISSITGLVLYTPILNDPNYIIKTAACEPRVLWGAFFEILLAFANIGTAITLYPMLKKHNESLAMGSVCFRLLEAMIIIIGILSLLSIVSLNHAFLNETHPEISTYLVMDKLLLVIHNWTFLYGPNLMLAPSTFITGYLFYKHKIVPRFIAALGMAGGSLIAVSSILVMFGVYLQLSFLGGLMAMPVFGYEVSLAVWLLVKGFNPPPAAVRSLEKITKFGRD